MTFVTIDQCKTKADLLEDSREFARACFHNAEEKAARTKIYSTLLKQDRRSDATIFKLRYIIDELKEVITDQYFDNKKAELTDSESVTPA